MIKIKDLMNFLDKSVNEYYASRNIQETLENQGFTKLNMSDKWNLKNGASYYLVNDETSIIAFKMGLKSHSGTPFQIVASHIDSPVLKLKPNGIIINSKFTKLNTEIYGGPILYSWHDKPLSIAGRIFVKENGIIVSKLVDSKNPVTIIPTPAIHLKQDVGLNPQKDLLPLISLKDEESTIKLLKKIFKIKEEIVSFDLSLYNATKSTLLGVNQELLSSARIDNLECAYTSLMSFIDSSCDDNINIYVSFNNEEVGSSTKQGAGSTFLRDVLLKISGSEIDLCERASKSFMVSADNAHGMHPNYPELADPTNMVYLNEGVVIKHNSQTRYTTDGLSNAVMVELAEKAKSKIQHYTNRSDQRGGSTLGAISTTKVSMATVDIGLAQLAMHSTYETAGVKDIEEMYKLLKTFYSLHICLGDKKIEIRGEC